jgi:hypothetical protein
MPEVNKEQKAVSKSLWGPFSSLFEVTSCDWYFSDYAFESVKVLKITISILNNFTLVLDKKIVFRHSAVIGFVSGR